MFEEVKYKLIRYGFSLLMGSIGLIKPTVDTVLLCCIFIAIDVFSAWDLSRRLKNKYNIEDPDFGLFTSEKSGVAFDTIIKLLCMILLANILDHVFLPQYELNLQSYLAVAFCAWEFWSILENFSSENENGWAKFCQKIMINKAKRHFENCEINYEDLKKAWDETHSKSNKTTVNGCESGGEESIQQDS